jgi:hypothetical protein
MTAPKKNEFYKNRKKNGRELIFKTPKELLDKAYEYFEWCDNNPVEKNEAIKSGIAAGKIIPIPIRRPYTLGQLCVYIGVSRDTFKSYEKRKGFLLVATHIRDIIEANQLEGALVEIYNPNIVARMLGLSEKKEIAGKDGGDLVINVTSEKTKDSLNELKEYLS